MTGRRTPPRHGARHARGRWRAQAAAWGFLAPVVLYLLAFYAYPLYRNIDLSIRSYTLASFVIGDAPFAGFANYISIFHSSTFSPALINTTIFVFVSIAFQFGIGLALAVFFYRGFPPVRDAPGALPDPLAPAAAGVRLYLVVDAQQRLGHRELLPAGRGRRADRLADLAALVAAVAVLIANIWIGIPFNLVIMYSGLQSISTDIFEAAAIDGANVWQRFWRVTFPLLRSVSAITLLLGFIYTLKVFDIIWIMTRGGPATASTTLAIWSYQLGFGSLLPDFSSAAAVGNVLIIIAVIFALIYIRARNRLDTT